MTFKENIARLRHDSISCGCSGCHEFRRVTTYWADILEVAHDREISNTVRNSDLDALERACEEVLDGNTLKAVMQAKRRIIEQAKGGAK